MEIVKTVQTSRFNNRGGSEDEIRHRIILTKGVMYRLKCLLADSAVSKKVNIEFVD